MSYYQSPALTRHVLDSILPYQIKPYQSKPILKTRQFYKPQQFIWNNPHRASDTIYKFYHQYNDQYEKIRAPIVNKMEQRERQETQINRIKKLTQIRKQTRQRFFTRQKQRQNLEGVCGTRQKNSISSLSSQTGETNEYVQKKFSTLSHYHPKPSKYESMIPSYLPSKIPPRKSQRLLRNIEQTYLTAVQKSDNKRKNIQGLIISQTHQHQNSLREQFQKQKQINSRRMSQISKFQMSKLETKSLYKDV